MTPAETNKYLKQYIQIKSLQIDFSVNKLKAMILNSNLPIDEAESFCLVLNEIEKDNYKVKLSNILEFEI
jgi:hypothetical protein